MNDLNVVHAAAARVCGGPGPPRRGREQRELDLIADGAVAIRDGPIVAVGHTADVLGEWGRDGVIPFDASGKTVLPGLIECHSHPLFSGSRHAEYQLRLDGASVAGDRGGRRRDLGDRAGHPRAGDGELMAALDVGLHADPGRRA